jgi:two-component system sensor histidine kinase TtrS
LKSTLRAGSRLAALLLVIAAAAMAAESPEPVPAAAEIRIGVLAFLGDEAAIGEWSPVVRRLTAALPGARVTLARMDRAGLDAAAVAGHLDFVITNPGHYVELEEALGASRILTVATPGMPSPDRSLGSVVVARADDTDLRTLADLRGRRVAIVGREAFGGYQTVWRELAAIGIDPERDFRAITEVGFPMDGVLAAVERGDADAGIVRTCLLESRAAMMSRFRFVGLREEPAFPCATSTRLYPGWPMATLRHTPAALAKSVVVALLGMSAHQDGMAWAVPADYQTVHELFRELQIGPYAHLREPTLIALAQRYWPWVAALALLLSGWILYTVRVEHLVHARTAELRAALAGREALEARVRANQEQADHLARLSMLGELSGTLAHELNQPLAAIGNYASSLLRRADGNRLTQDATREAAAEIAGQAERAAGILGRIRGFAHKRAAQREHVAVAALAREAVALFRGMLTSAPPVEIIDELPPGRSVEVDPLQIQQVLLNLLKNGYDASRALSAERRRMEVRLSPQGNDVRIAVRDYGAGLDAAARGRLFEPFFTTKPEGLGLGLSICKTIAEAHGGRLVAEAPAGGHGMEFILTLHGHD